MRLLRRHSLERRLFGWMLALALVPSLLLLATGAWLWAGSIGWVGSLGPWDRVAESGRAVFESAEPAAARDPALARAIERHRADLSSSLVQARRLSFLSARLARAVPVLAFALALLLALAALAASRRVARQLARPIRELHDWAELLAREEPLPPPARRERREVREVRALRDALRRASVDLAEARRRALEAERVRVWGDLARRVAHEMRNALTPLGLATRRLAGAAGDASLAEPLDVVRAEARRLEELAREFAALGRPPEGPVSPIDVGELVRSLAGTDVPPPASISVDIEPELPLVEGHYDALLRSFRNLIRNAVEASAATGVPAAVEVRVRSAGRPEGGVVVEVADRGPGLPGGAGERIFEPDFTTKSRGTGLGLPIVHQTVRAHGGEVIARDREGGGAVFIVRLPAIPSSQLPEPMGAP